MAAGGNFENWDIFCAARAVSVPQLAIDGSGLRVVMDMNKSAKQHLIQETGRSFEMGV